MCVKPVYIVNPYYGQERRGLSALHDCSMQKIAVPCGTCAECVAMRQMDISQRVYLAALDNYCAMFTLTYSPEALPRASYTDADTGEAVEYSYASIADVQVMFRTLRQSPRGYFDGIPFKYLVVSEYGGQRHRPHYHGVLFFPKSCFPAGQASFVSFCERWKMAMHDCWSRNVGTRKNPVWVRNSRYVRRMSKGRMRSTYDFHAIVPRSGDRTSPERTVSYYVTKYLNKQFGADRKFEYRIRKTALEGDAAREFHRRRCKMTFSKNLWTNGFRSKSDPRYSDVQARCVQESVDYSSSEGKGRFVFRMSDGTTTPMGISLRRRLTLHQYLCVLSDLPDGHARIPERYLTYDERMSREMRGLFRVETASSRNALEDFDDLYAET